VQISLLEHTQNGWKEMITLRPRGKSFHADFIKRDVRLRGSLGTRNRDAASVLCRDLDVAITTGPHSDLWPKLKAVLPAETYQRFAAYTGVKEHHVPNWAELKDAFEVSTKQRIAIRKLAQSTADRYQHTIDEFDAFLTEQRVCQLPDISKALVEKFKVWRTDRIAKRKFSRQGTSLALDAAILHRVFSFAVENEMVVKNPVRMEGRPGENPTNGAEPFTAGELAKLRKHVADDLLAFTLLRWTGLRGSDAVALTWKEVHFDMKEIERLTQKRKKKVVLPIQSELLALLEMERDKRNPKPEDTVLLNPETGKKLDRPRLYKRLLCVGKRAGVSNARPHRFRDTLAVDMLSRGANPYDVAKMLGDTIETIEKHYTPFVKELRERVRTILESDGGLENMAAVTPASQQPARVQ
jgi:site-specific recombinase XerD